MKGSMYLVLDFLLNQDEDSPVFGMCPVYRSKEEAQHYHPDSELLAVEFWANEEA